MTPKQIIDFIVLLTAFLSVLMIILWAAFLIFRRQALIECCAYLFAINGTFIVLLIVLKFVGGI